MNNILKIKILILFGLIMTMPIQSPNTNLNIDPNVEDITIQLIEALEENDIKKTIESIQAGANVNVASTNYIAERDFKEQDNTTKKYVVMKADTPLHRAIAMNRLSIVTELLNASGIEVNKANNSNDTPLHYAAMYNRSQILKLLIKKNADVNQVNNLVVTPLSYAVSEGNTANVTTLLKAGAKANIADDEYLFPLDIANSKGYEKIAELLKAADATPEEFIIAEAKNQCDLIEDEYEYDDAITNKMGEIIHSVFCAAEYKNKPTPLAHAIMLGQIKEVREIIELQDTKDQRDSQKIVNEPCDYEGWTPLRLAVFWNQSEIAQYLRSFSLKKTIAHFINNRDIPYEDRDIPTTLKSFIQNQAYDDSEDYKSC